MFYQVPSVFVYIASLDAKIFYICGVALEERHRKVCCWVIGMVSTGAVSFVCTSLQQHRLQFM